MRALLCAALLALAGQAVAQPGLAPQGQPVSADARRLKDAEFGVSTRQLGLQRRVEMYQWVRHGDGYAMDWRAEPVDSTGFAPGHANPGRFPLPTRYWVGQGITLDGTPLDEDVLKELGRWQRFRPGFSALPGNLAATFQPEGDGLSSAENPLEPRLGDLRVTWHELVLPPLEGRVVLQDGSWRLAPAAAAAGETGAAGAAQGATAARGGASFVPWAVGAALVLVLLMALGRRMRRRSAGRAP